MRNMQLLKPSLVTLCTMIALCIGGAPLKAESLTAFAHILTPFNNGPEDPKQGITYGLVSEMLARSNFDMQSNTIPFARAVQQVGDTPNGIIFPLAYSEQRAPNFSWIAQLMEINLIFATKGGAVNSIEEARSLGRIAVVQESIMMNVLSGQEFDNLYVVSTEEQAALMVANGRVDAWFTIDISAERIMEHAGIDSASITIGEGTNRFDLWLGASLAFNPEHATLLQNALEDMRNDGTYDQIIADNL